MFYSLHNLHLIFDFLIQHSILDKAALLNLFGGIWHSIVFGRYFVDDGKCSLANHTNAIVLAGPVPLSPHVIFALCGRALLARWAFRASRGYQLASVLEQINMASRTGSDGFNGSRQ